MGVVHTREPCTAAIHLLGVDLMRVLKLIKLKYAPRASASLRMFAASEKTEIFGRMLVF